MSRGVRIQGYTEGMRVGCSKQVATIGVILGLYWGYMGIMEKKMETLL